MIEWLSDRMKTIYALSSFYLRGIKIVKNYVMHTWGQEIKVALGVCFALKSWKEYLLLFTYIITLGKDVTFQLITKFKTNRPPN